MDTSYVPILEKCKVNLVWFFIFYLERSRPLQHLASRLALQT